MVKKVTSSQPFVDAIARKYRNQLRASMPPPSVKREAALPLANRTNPRNPSSLVDSSTLVGEVDSLKDQSFWDKLSDPNSGPGKVIDVISQPLYAAAQTLAELDDREKEEGIGSVANAILNPFAKGGSVLGGNRFMGNLGTGNNKRTASDLLRDAEFTNDRGEVRTTGNNLLSANESDDNWNKAAKIGGSLGIDIAMDPTTYIPGAAFAAVGKVGKTAIKAPLTAAAKSGVAPVAAVGKAGLKVGHAAGAPGRAVGRAITPKGKKELAEEVGEFSEAAAALSPANAARLEDLMDRASKNTVTEKELEEISVLTGRSLEEIADVAPAAARDAKAINEGTFVPKVKIKAEEAIGPKKAVLKGPSGKVQAYDDVLKNLLRRSDAEDAVPMYPELTGLTRAPFTQFKPKATPKTVATEAARTVDPEPAVLDDILEEADEIEEIRPPKIVDKGIDAQLTKLLKAKPGLRAPDGMTMLRHVELASVPEARAATILKNAWRELGIKGTPNERDVVRAQRSSQDVVNMLKANMQAAIAGLPSPFPGGRNPAQAANSVPSSPVSSPAVASGTPAGSKVAEAVEKVSDKVDEIVKAAETPKAKKPDIRMWGGKVKTQYINKLINEYGVHPVHVAELMSSTTKAGFMKRLKNMQAWKTTGEPHYKVVELIVGSPDNVKPTILDDAKPGVITASEQMENGVAGGKTAAEIAEDAATGLSAETLEAWRWAFGNSPVTQNWTGIDESLKWKSLIEKTLRDNPNYRQGYGVNRESVNAKAQANIFRSVIGAASNEAKKAGLKGAQRAEYVRTFVIKSLDESDAALRAIGIQPIATFSKTGWPVSLGDVFNILNNSAAGRRFLDGRVFDGFGKELVGRKVAEGSLEGTIKVDALLNAVRPILDTLFKEVPEFADPATLAKAIKKIVKEGVSAKLVRTVKTEAQALPITSLQKGADGTYVPKALPTTNVDKVATEVTEILLDPSVVKGLFQAAHNNAAAVGIVVGQRVNAISEDAITQVVNILGDPKAGTRTIAETLSTSGKQKVLAQAEEATEVGKTDPLISGIASEKYDEILSEIVSVEDLKSAQYLVDISRAVEKGDDKFRLAAIQQQYADAVSEGFHSQTVATLMKSGESTAVAMDSGIAKMLMSFIGGVGNRMFNHWDNATIHSALMKGGNVGRVFQGIVRKNLNNVARNFSKDEIKEAFVLLQKGIPTEGAGKIGEAAEALRNNVDLMFRIPDNALVDPRSGLFSEFMAKGFDIDHVLQKMEHGRIAVPEKYRFNKAAAEASAKENGTTVAHEYSKQWQKWDVEDPVEFLAQMSTVMGGLATDSSVAMEAVRIAKSLNRASSTPRKGMVKYIPDPKHNVLSKYFPEGTYFDKDIVGEFKKMDEILSDSTKVHWFVDNVLSPITQRWKAGMTIYHLGHHTRNLIGDVTMSFLQDGVKSPVYYHRAARMMMGKNNIRGAYTEWDAIAAMKGVTTSMTQGKHAAKVKIGRRTQTLSDDEVQRLAMNEGILPDFAVQEDILDTARSGPGSSFAQGVDKLFDKKSPFKGRIRKVAGRAAEARDDYVRMAHFMHMLEHPPKGGFKSVDDAVKYAAAAVRKAHPDGSDLTSFERNLRILFPFYSWMRKAIPLIIESTLIHPARVNTYPKAMYAWGQANGLDLESLSEPFPEDSLYPSFLKNNMTGPGMLNEAGQAVGMDFGAPQADIMNDFLPNPTKGMMGMLNPLVKMPVELATGSRMQTKSKINDTGEYVESNIPGLAQLGQLTGYSPLNSIKEGEPVKQTQVAKGNRQAVGEGSAFGFDPGSLLNRTLNVGYTNYETPSFRNIAEMEKRDSAKEARNKALKEMGMG